MKRILSILLVIAGFSSFTACAQAADGPTIPKRTVNVTLWRFGRYWPNPAAKEPQYKTWCWVPRLQFQVIGPVPGGCQWIVEFNKPDGKPWLVRKCRTEEIGDGELTTVKTPDIDYVKDEKKATIAKLGSFPFRIRLKNALAGTNTVMFSGKYSVKTYAPNQAIPEYKNKSEFYVDEDWRLPIGYIWLDPTRDDTAFPLKVSLWFHNIGSNSQIEAVLFKDGVQVLDAVGNSEDTELATGVGDNAHRWSLRTFEFTRVCKLVDGAEEPSGYSRYYLNKNPGNYEIKVLRDNNLVRSAKFSVDAGGNVVDNGIAKSNKLGGIRMVLPVKVIGASDGRYNVAAWKTGALYANPLKGFVAP